MLKFLGTIYKLLAMLKIIKSLTLVPNLNLGAVLNHFFLNKQLNNLLVVFFFLRVTEKTNHWQR
jgi:hypothetical protein